MRYDAPQSQPQSRWQHWRHTLLFGLPLGLLTFGLFAASTAAPNALPPQHATLIGWLLCLVIPGAAGYHFCYQGRHQGWESGWAGFRVGLVGCALFMFGAIVWLLVALIIYDNTPAPSGPRDLYSPSLALVYTGMLVGFLALLTLVGLTFSAASGRIGGALAILRFQTHDQQV